jgi:hypothetical protein
VYSKYCQMYGRERGALTRCLQAGPWRHTVGNVSVAALEHLQRHSRRHHRGVESRLGKLPRTCFDELEEWVDKLDLSSAFPIELCNWSKT